MAEGESSASRLLHWRLLPTWASSEDIRRWDSRLREQAVLSARTTRSNYLDTLRQNLSRVASRNLKPFQARDILQHTLDSMGYRPQTGFPEDAGRHGPNGETIPPARPGSIRDLASSHRINLIMDTSVKQARSMGQIAASENPVFLMANPAWRLTRTGARKKPRGDWKSRWAKAGASCGWIGACREDFVALKDSPIWKAIGDGAGGFKDTLGTNFPPFAFGSGMAWVNVGRREWQRLCAKEGIPDGLDNLKAKVADGVGKESGSRQDKAAASRYSEALDRLRTARDKAAAERGEWVPPATFKPDESQREHAIERIMAVRHSTYMAKARVEDCMERVEKALEKVRKAQADFPKADLAAVLAAILAAQNGIASELSSLESTRRTLNGYARLAKEAGTPKDSASQESFNTSMDLYAKAAESSRAKVSEFVAKARSHAAAAEAEAGRTSDIVTAWKKSECARIIGDADSIVASFSGDDYEKMLDEAKAAVSAHNAEMKKIKSGNQ